MDGLIIQVLSKSASPFEEERLKRWREEAPENEDYFQEMSKVWALTEPEPVAVSSGPPDLDVVLQAAGDSLDLAQKSGVEQDEPNTALPFQKEAHHLKERKSPWIRWGLLAASLVAVAFGLRAFAPGGIDPIASYQVASGQTATYTLEDGSFVRLTDGARLQEWAVEGGREVTLDGKGFFAVARDETRPFVVKTSVGNVRVLGTRFQVLSQPGWAETVVVEGLVEVSNEEGAVEVPAGNVARMDRDSAPTSESVPDVHGLLDWPGGALLFQGTPLSQVAQEVSRHYSQTIEILDPELGNRQVTAWFEDEPFEAITESLCLVTEATCTWSDVGLMMGLNAGGGRER